MDFDWLARKENEITKPGTGVWNGAFCTESPTWSLNFEAACKKFIRVPIPSRVSRLLRSFVVIVIGRENSLSVNLIQSDSCSVVIYLIWREVHLLWSQVIICSSIVYLRHEFNSVCAKCYRAFILGLREFNNKGINHPIGRCNGKRSVHVELFRLNISLTLRMNGRTQNKLQITIANGKEIQF